MSEERKMILQMLKEGKISEEAALRLIEALGDNKEQVEANKFDFLGNTQKFADNLVKSVDKILKKTGEKISSIDIDYDFDLDLGDKYKYSFGKNRSKANKVEQFDVNTDDEIKVYINNSNGPIEVLKWEENYVQVKTDVDYNEKYLDEDYDFVNNSFENGILTIDSSNKKYKKQPFNASIKVFMPEVNIGDVLIKSNKGSIKASEIKANNFIIKSVNGSVTVSDLYGNKLEIKTTNGTINTNLITGEDIKLETINGKINYNQGQVKNAVIKTINGTINADLVGLNSEHMNLDTVNGSININLEDLTRPIKLEASKLSKLLSNLDVSNEFTEAVEDDKKSILTTKSYTEDAENKLLIEASTVNGRISVE